jgi:hypothetical protein
LGYSIARKNNKVFLSVSPDYIRETMPTFQCKTCGKKIKADYLTCECTEATNFNEQKNPTCCGQPMLEIVDD